MPDVTDYVIEYKGARPSSDVDDFKGIDNIPLDLGIYNQRQQFQGKKRVLVRHALGVSDSAKDRMLEPSYTRRYVDEIVAARNAGTPIGLVCISGYSKGSMYAVRLVQELNAASVEVRYVGLSDLPIFPYGYDPRVPSFPDMVPVNEPSTDTAASARAVQHPLRVKFPPQVAPPQVRAKEMANYYQHRGNGVEVRRHPRLSYPWWWWSSNMPNDEVHGELQGWTNTELRIAEQINDSKCHDVGDEEGRKRIGADISHALAIFQ
ncbi:hypothetical protein [Propylenella binzhouense]|uniref:Uncharacterized protein n=1 Tax=Propylenella binzhouense TaxID=2555902 RepID=A0A964WUC9_9HYPH|nr:hypothetical protein [Propylenella binzhouense]MYZ48903.1 hypothetical protein [Propylenella binzhouense]